MNDYEDKLPEPDDFQASDPALEEALAHLKRLEPPLETRVAIRSAVAAELDAMHNANRQRRVPWWRRSISVPLPIAASVLVAAALAVAASTYGWMERSSGDVAVPQQAEQRSVEPGDERRAVAMGAATRRDVNTRAELKFYATETYLCGIGQVSSESRYEIKEQ